VAHAFRLACPDSEPIATDCYGVVYYFPRRYTQLDADNISKTVWDALKSVAYDDDRVVRLRIAGIANLRSPDMVGFDLTKMPGDVAAKLLAMVGQVDHLLYIEVGALRAEMFRFALDSGG
jgi:Endodeoxyribonuclease RusA.